ncbi:MAG: glycoside hydrolase family 65 protein [Halanaerobiales bacterium]
MIVREFHKKKLGKERLYKYEPWRITEEEFKVENNHHNESIFSLGNGYMGLRGTLEEDYSGPEKTTTPGMYINGVYGSQKIAYGEEAPKQPQYSQTILNLPDWTIINIYLDGEKFNMLEGKVEKYGRYLDMRQGMLNRDLIWESSRGRRIRITTSRFLSLTDPHLGMINFNIKTLNFSGTVKLVSAVDGSNHNYYYLCDNDSIEVIDAGFTGDQDRTYLLQYIPSTDITVALAVINELQVEADSTSRCFSLIDGDYLLQEFTVEAEKGINISLTKYASFYTSFDVLEGDLKETALQEAIRGREVGYMSLLNDHYHYLQKYWQDVDVRLDGDPALQQAFRFNAFHLLQSTGRDGNTNAPAKGLTGEFYEGHYFWDTETYVFPFFLYNRPEIARALLKYRYNVLDKARENAERVRLQGALFPWRTINGEEASAFFMGSTVQFHINADIAYAIYQYCNATGDENFLYEYGVEILIETARMWASRGSYIPLLGNKFCFNEVCGPDEYKPGVSNNCYTNYMAKFNLEFAIEAVKMMKENRPAEFRSLAKKLDFSIDDGGRELESWEEIAEDIYLPYNEELGIHPQDDSFLLKDAIDIDKLPSEDFPLVHNWHPLTIWRYQVIKQADVILLMFLLGDRFTLEEKKANYDYYEPRTTHDSSLSPSIYSIIASEIGFYDDAYRYFIQTARLDLDDFNENTYQGLHLACMGSAWLTLVHGFAGMRNYEGILHFNPYLPEKWDSYEFNIKYRNSKIKVYVEKERVIYTLLSGEQVIFYHHGRKIRLNRQKPEVIKE